MCWQCLNGMMDVGFDEDGNVVLWCAQCGTVRGGGNELVPSRTRREQEEREEAAERVRQAAEYDEPPPERRRPDGPDGPEDVRE